MKIWPLRVRERHLNVGMGGEGEVMVGDGVGKSELQNEYDDY